MSDDPDGGCRDVSESIMQMIRPSVEKLDTQVKNTRKSQISLIADVNQIAELLKQINDNQLQMPFDLEKLTSLSTRMTAIHDRISQLQRQIARETFRHKNED
ncbi:Biogenesis of lysosome-related organelles complex 1 subunit 7 [Aphelenchoides besseyi]|nr:Biogenesis of lysosome-related organelles complex 1 subunit 7 [Aphelenchoides besseyi]KAI6208952.1 Biogenesis of lysosome-related organelles complex 1 subunit 7 [Aphelenchoides besseyi]